MSGPSFSERSTPAPPREDHYLDEAGRALVSFESEADNGCVDVHEVREWHEIDPRLRSKLRAIVQCGEVQDAISGFRLLFPNLEVDEQNLVRL